MLVRLVQLQIAGGLGGGPGEDQGGVVDEGGLGQLAEGVLVVGDVDEGEQDAEVVLVLEGADAGVDVFRVEAVVFEACVLFVSFGQSWGGGGWDRLAVGMDVMCLPEKQRAGRLAQAVVGGNVAVFP